MFTMERIMTRYLGDWLYDESKLKELTEERAVSDIYDMSKSPDYNGDDINVALDMAAEQLNIDRLQLVAGLMVKDADKMSKV